MTDKKFEALCAKNKSGKITPNEREAVMIEAIKRSHLEWEKRHERS